MRQGRDAKRVRDLVGAKVEEKKGEFGIGQVGITGQRVSDNVEVAGDVLAEQAPSFRVDHAAKFAGGDVVDGVGGVQEGRLVEPSGGAGAVGLAKDAGFRFGVP